MTCLRIRLVSRLFPMSKSALPSPWPMTTMRGLPPSGESFRVMVRTYGPTLPLPLPFPLPLMLFFGESFGLVVGAIPELPPPLPVLGELVGLVSSGFAPPSPLPGFRPSLGHTSSDFLFQRKGSSGNARPPSPLLFVGAFIWAFCTGFPNGSPFPTEAGEGASSGDAPPPSPWPLHLRGAATT